MMFLRKLEVNTLLGEKGRHSLKGSMSYVINSVLLIFGKRKMEIGSVPRLNKLHLDVLVSPLNTLTRLVNCKSK